MVERTNRSAADFLLLDDRALLDQCEVDTYRASGPGGQKRNKTSSAVRLRHGPTGLLVTATEERSQHLNRARALRRLRRSVALHVRTTVDPAVFVASDLLASCVSSGGRLEVGKRDHRYNVAVGEILDLFAACGTGTRETAERLGVSTANLVRFFAAEPKLWERINQMRVAAGVTPLR